MIGMVQAHNSQVLLIGMKLPPNYGPHYADAFSALYEQLAKQNGIRLVAFLLEGVAGNRALMQADGIHPVAAAQARLLDNVWPQLLPLLDN